MKVLPRMCRGLPLNCCYKQLHEVGVVLIRVANLTQTLYTPAAINALGYEKLFL